MIKLQTNDIYFDRIVLEINNFRFYTPYKSMKYLYSLVLMYCFCLCRVHNTPYRISI